MNNTDYILDTPLPESEDFNFLRNAGLEIIQQHSGIKWSNFNASDPGMTILDQLCYALTELGYCNNFPVEDILTNEKGEFILKNQFFTPDQVLTISPVTITDYKKYIIDKVNTVKNIVLSTLPINISKFQGDYVTRFIANSDASDNIVGNAVYSQLNNVRNIGENFIYPKPFLPVNFNLSGIIELDADEDPGKLQNEIISAINNYIFPTIKQYGYEELINQGFDADAIFNGPILKSGWINDADLKSKKNTVSCVDLAMVISKVEGVSYVNNLQIELVTENVTGASLKDGILTTPEEVLATFQILYNQSNKLVFKRNGNVINPQENNSFSDFSNNILKSGTEKDISATLNKLPELPKGTFRDIESYYSIQNTFPEIYAVGPNAYELAGKNATELRKAQSRQLKGYLLIFDQVLANQFSQLANIPKLFSFKNALYNDYVDRENYNNNKNLVFRDHTSFPVPFQRFSPSYFFQALYNIPNVSDLLAGNEAYQYSIESENYKELFKKSWKEYKENPYNKYIIGLMQYIENENTAINRRLEMLNHLLARHGEAGDSFIPINGNMMWSGERAVNEILVKSIYLQNFDKLSYNKNKGYNYLKADKLLPVSESKIDNPKSDLYTDFILDARKIESLNELNEKDFVNFSGLELKLNLIFGFQTYYHKIIQILKSLKLGNNSFFYSDIVLNQQDDATIITLGNEPILEIKGLSKNEITNEIYTNYINQLEWLAQQRRGSLLIENHLLLKSAKYQFYLLINDDDNQVYVIDKELLYDEAIALYNALVGSGSIEIEFNNNSGTVNYLDTAYRFKSSENSFQPNPDKYVQGSDISGTKYFICGTAVFDEAKESANEKVLRCYLEDPIFSCKTEMILPDYISLFQQDYYKNAIANKVDENIPLHITNNLQFLLFDQLSKDIIPAFIEWHNVLGHPDKVVTEGMKYAKQLVLQLLIINNQ